MYSGLIARSSSSGGSCKNGKYVFLCHILHTDGCPKADGQNEECSELVMEWMRRGDGFPTVREGIDSVGDTTTLIAILSAIPTS